MIFSIIEMENEHEGVQKVVVRGKHEDVARELENIMAELVKRGFPEDMLFSITYNALKNSGRLA